MSKHEALQCSQNSRGTLGRPRLFAALIAAASVSAVPQSPGLSVVAYDFTTLAGTAGVTGSMDATGAAASFNSPGFVAVDGSGTVYVADNENQSIREVSPAGVVTTLVPRFPNNNFNGPQGIAVDASGNVYVADEGHGTIDKVSPAGVVSLLAGGNPSNTGSPDGTGSGARFSYPMGIAVDAQGNVYVADMEDNSVRIVSPAGVVTTLAGTNSGVPGFADGTRSAAKFFSPQAVAVDSSGNVYVADTSNAAVRKVTPAGVVTTIAGRAQGIRAPQGIAVDPSGNVFVSDDDAIKEITPTGAISIAGGGPGNTGSIDGTGGNALFNRPVGLAVDSSGNLYVADDFFNNTIRKGTAQAVNTPAVSSQPSDATVASGQSTSFTVSATGAPPLTYQWKVLNPALGTFAALSDGGPYSGTSSSTLTITGAIGSLDGNRYECVVDDGTVPAVSNPATLTVNYLSPIAVQTPSETTIAGGSVNFAVGVSGDPLPSYQWQESTNNGSAWSNISDGGAFSGSNTATLTISPAAASLSGAEFRATVSNSSGSRTSAAATLTVNGVPAGDATGYLFTTLMSPSGYGDANGSASVASVASLGVLAVDFAGTLYTVGSNSVITTVSPQGVLGTRTAPGASFLFAVAAAADGPGNLYVADYSNVWKVAPSGTVTLLAGPESSTAPSGAGVAVDPSGNVYFADTRGSTIQKITPFGAQSTFAGSAGQTGSADGQGSAARFSGPTYITSDASGNLYVVDQQNYTVRKITPAGRVSTLAGSPGLYGHQDGTGAGATLQNMNGIAADAAGNVFVVDGTYLTIRKITAAGVVTTVAGQPTLLHGNVDGFGDAATFFYPGAIAVDGAGNLYVTDGEGNRIRKGTPAAVSLGTATHLSFSTPQTVATGTKGTFTISAVNALDSTVTGYSGTVHFSTPLSGVDLPPDTPLVNGTATVQATFNSSGYGSLSAIDNAASPIAGISQLIFVQVPLSSQTITFTQPHDVLTTSAPIALSASATSGEPVTFTLLGGPATLSQNIVTLTGAPGTVSVVASQAGDSTHSAAPNVTITFKVFASGIPPTITAQPTPQTANAGASAAFFVEAAGSPPLSYQWSLGGAAIAGATTPLLLLPGVQASSAGSYSVVVTNASGTATSTPAPLAINAAGSPPAPTVAAQPQPQTAASGSTVVFSVSAGAASAATSLVGVQSVRASSSASQTLYQWFFGANPIAGATSPTLVVSDAGTEDSGLYSCLITTQGGSLQTKGAALTIVTTSNPGRLTNVSCRAQVGTGANILIAGFVIGGAGTSGSEPILVRASGPALAAFSVPGILPDPVLSLYGTGAQQKMLSENDAWGGAPAIVSAAASVGAFAWASPTSHDTALIPALPAGSYTANISGQSGDSGVALAEVYDETPAGSYTAASPRLTNVSTRVSVGSGSGILIAGFAIGGTTAKTVLIRASGPALAAFNVSGLLSQPKITLFSGSAPLATNAGWAGDTSVKSVAASVGAFSWPDPSSKDSAILVTLPPGPYTVQVAGADGGTGVALVEVYDVP